MGVCCVRLRFASNYMGNCSATARFAKTLKSRHCGWPSNQRHLQPGQPLGLPSGMATNARFAATSLDKRRWRRVHFTVPVRVTVDKSRHVTVINSCGCHMNPGGIGFSADTELAVGDEVEIVLTDYRLTLRGVIRDRTGNRYGVEFLAKSAEENEQLALFRQILSSRLGCLDA